RFGPFCAALLSLGLAAIFPLASAFLPGVANDFGLEQICTLWGVLLPVAGPLAGRHASRWFFAGGVAGGCGLWLSAMGQVPVLAGIAGGGSLAALQARGGPKEPSAEGSTLLPWRAWAFGGAGLRPARLPRRIFPGAHGTAASVHLPPLRPAGV